MPARREAALAAHLDRELLVRSDVVHEQVHQAQLVREAREHVQAGRVERDRVHLLGEHLGDVRRLVHVVPHAHAPVDAARGHERLAHRAVEAGDHAVVEGLREQLEVHFVCAQDVRVRERERVHLRVRQRAHELLLGRRDGESLDFDRVLLDAQALGFLVVVLVVALLEDVDQAAVRAAHEALRVRDYRVDRRAVRGRGRERTLELAGLEQQQLTRVGRHNDALLAHPRVTQVRLRLALAHSAGQRLERLVSDAQEAADAVARHADHSIVNRVEAALVDGVVLRVGGLRDGADLCLLPLPVHERPIGRAAVREQTLRVGREGQAHKLA